MAVYTSRRDGIFRAGRWLLLALTGRGAGGGDAVDEASGAAGTPPAVGPLSADDRIEAEMIVGGYFVAGGAPPAIDVPSIASIRGGVGLVVPEIAGDPVADPALARRTADELARLLGGWFAEDLTPYLDLCDHLVSRQERESYRAAGATIDWDKPRTAFYSLACAAGPWQVRAVGEVGVFHAVFLGRLLDEGAALGPDGLPAARPLGPVEPVLAEAAPGVAERPLVDRTAEQPPNVFDTYLSDGDLAVKAGVRMRLTGDGAMVADGPAYFYGIRIDLDLRRAE